LGQTVGYLPDSAVSISTQLSANDKCRQLSSAVAPPFAVFEGWDHTTAQKFYRFAWPRAIFLTFGFFDPRGYSRGFKGFSALRFLRAARLDFLRSSLLNVDVLAMNSLGFLI
jgi:hypothetical protein